MARGNAAVRVSIQADNSDLRRGTREAESDLGRLQRSGSKSLDRLKSAALGAGVALTGGLIAGLVKSVNAAREAEASQAKLEAQLKASGISYKAHAAEIDRVIQKHAQLAAVDDEDLQDAFTNIVRATGNVKQSLGLVGLAADIARARHLDLSKAGQLVGKVANGNTGILKRYGVEVAKGATAQEALAAAQKKFAGQSEAYGKTTSGAIDRAKNAVQNLQEKIGGALAPTIADVANKVARFVDELRTGTGAGGRFRDRLQEIVDKVRPIAKFFADHPRLIALAVAAWAAYKVASLAALAAIKVQTFRKAFAKSVPVAAEQGTAAGVAYAGGFDAGAAGGINKAGKSGKALAAIRGLGRAFGVLAAGEIVAEIGVALTEHIPKIQVNIPGIGPIGIQGVTTAGSMVPKKGAGPEAATGRGPGATVIRPSRPRPRRRGGIPANKASVSTVGSRGVLASASGILEEFYDPVTGLASPGHDHYDHVHVAATKAELPYLMSVARRFGLTITSTTGGQHAPNSYHYRGMAFDSAGPPAAMAAFAKWVRDVYNKGGARGKPIHVAAKPKPRPSLVGTVGPSVSVGGFAIGDVGSTITAGLGSGAGFGTTVTKPMTDLYAPGDGSTASGEDPNQGLIDAQNAAAAAAQAQADALTSLVAEVKRGNDITLRLGTSEFGTLKAAIADVVSGQIGGRVGLGWQTPGFAGGRVRY